MRRRTYPAEPSGLARTTVYPSGSRSQTSQWFGPPFAGRWIAVTRHQHLRLHPLPTGDGSIDIINLEPEQHAIPVRPYVRIAYRTVVMLDVPSVQLQYQGVP